MSLSVEGMSQEDLREKALCVAKHTLSGKTDLERSAVLHQHIGSRSMGDMVIETFEPGPGEHTTSKLERDSNYILKIDSLIAAPSSPCQHKL